MNRLSDKYGTSERQKILLSMLKDVHNMFEKNGIKYSLGSGTLLGAIRENGFIPWDDDLDLMVDRENYNKIIKMFSDGYNNESYELRNILWISRIQIKSDETDLMVPSIDIFIMDNNPDNRIISAYKLLLVMILQGMMKEDINYKEYQPFFRMCLFVSHIMGLPFSNNTLFSWYMKASQIGNNRKTRYVTGYNDLFKLLKLKYDGDLLSCFIEHRFEDSQFPITCKYDNYLSTQYGDYMIPPTEDKRIPQHTHQNTTKKQIKGDSSK